MKKLVYILILAACLSGCGLYSKYKPVDTVDERVFGDLQLGDSAGNIANLGWREVFKDPYLQLLIDSALANNIDLKVAHEHVEQAQASLLGAKLSYLPSIQLNPGGEYNFTKNVSSGWYYNLGASASWEIDIFGRTWNSMKKAQSVKAMAEDYEQAARAELIAGVAEMYFTLLMLDQECEVAISTNEIWLETVEIIKQLKEAGMTNEVAVKQLEASCFEIQTIRIDIEYKIREVENALRLALNAPGMEIKRGKLREQVLPETFNVGVPVQILYNRPDVRAAQETMAQAHYARQYATADCLPRLSLSGMLGWTNGSGGVALDPFTMVANAAGNLLIPIFQSGRNIAQVRAAKSQQRESRLQFAKVVLAAGNEVNNTMADYQSCCKKKGLYTQQVDALVNAREATSQLMKYGSATYLDVLNAQNTLLNAQFTQIANDMQILISAIQLYHALGGGQK